MYLLIHPLRGGPLHANMIFYTQITTYKAEATELMVTGHFCNRNLLTLPLNAMRS